MCPACITERKLLSTYKSILELKIQHFVIKCCIFLYTYIIDILRNYLTPEIKFLKYFSIFSIVKVNSGRSNTKAEVTLANPYAEVTLANFTSLAYFML